MPRRVAFEDRAILGEGELPRRVLHWLPIRVLRAPLDVVDRLPIQFERRDQFDHWLDLARGRADRLDGGSRRTRARCRRPTDQIRRTVDVHHTSRREVPLQRSRGFVFDLRPRLLGDGRKLSVQVIHVAELPSGCRSTACPPDLEPCAPAPAPRRWQQLDGLPVGERAQELDGWCEEIGTGDRMGEIQQMVVIAGRSADDHVFEHGFQGWSERA